MKSKSNIKCFRALFISMGLFSLFTDLKAPVLPRESRLPAERGEFFNPSTLSLPQVPSSRLGARPMMGYRESVVLPSFGKYEVPRVCSAELYCEEPEVKPKKKLNPFKKIIDKVFPKEVGFDEIINPSGKKLVIDSLARKLEIEVLSVKAGEIAEVCTVIKALLHALEGRGPLGITTGDVLARILLEKKALHRPERLRLLDDFFDSIAQASISKFLAPGIKTHLRVFLRNNRKAIHDSGEEEECGESSSEGLSPEEED